MGRRHRRVLLSAQDRLLQALGAVVGLRRESGGHDSWEGRPRSTSWSRSIMGCACRTSWLSIGVTGAGSTGHRSKRCVCECAREMGFCCASSASGDAWRGSRASRHGGAWADLAPRLSISDDLGGWSDDSLVCGWETVEFWECFSRSAIWSVFSRNFPHHFVGLCDHCKVSGGYFCHFVKITLFVKQVFTSGA